MASFPRRGPARQLRELLQEQQEPFLVEVYLYENGCPWKSLNLDYACNCWPGDTDSRKNLRGFGRKCSKKKSVFLPKCSRLVRALLRMISNGRSGETSDVNGVSSANGNLSHCSCVSDMGRDKNMSSSFLNGNDQGSFSVLQHYNMFSSDDDGVKRQYSLINTKAFSDTKLNQRRCVEEWKQLSPVSVLGLASEEGSPAQKHYLYNGRTRQEDFQPTLPHWDFLLRSIKKKMRTDDQEQQELHCLDLSSQAANNKRVLRRSKQLLFDCAMEAVDNQLKKRRWCSQPCVEAKVLCDEIYAWGRQGGDVTNITQLLQWDLSSTSQAWGHTEPHTVEEIAVEIADAIFESMSDGLITAMLSC